MLALWKKNYDKHRQHITKQRCYFPDKVDWVKIMVCPVVVYGCESGTIKKAEHCRIDDFELCSWRRILRVPLELQGDQTCQFSRKSVLNILWKDWCWSWNSNSLANWEELTHWKRPSCWERLNVGGKWGGSGWDGIMASLTWWTWVWAGSASWWWTGKPGVLQSMGLQIVGHDWVTELDSGLLLLSLNSSKFDILTVFPAGG